MTARLCVAALHFNENGRRHQAVTRAGVPQWQLSYPKGKKGKHVVVKPRKTPVTYGSSYPRVQQLHLMEKLLLDTNHQPLHQAMLQSTKTSSLLQGVLDVHGRAMVLYSGLGILCNPLIGMSCELL
ncbi:uncharacterized protein LOC130053054 [Ostrea edulis]|uniref:uncharacterized protein LOC130053054 n=1 Tax=Ostrea edulis TaxID=37623 RepID=UPI0024AF20CC|nr:uncharacterized protein LOC130053054 [Ostrea edulis]